LRNVGDQWKISLRSLRQHVEADAQLREAYPFYIGIGGSSIPGFQGGTKARKGTIPIAREE